MLRLGLVIAGFTLLAAGLIALQWCLAKLNVRGRKKLSVLFLSRAVPASCAYACRSLARRPAQSRSLIVANHTSWLDIPVIASIMPAAFVAKSEVRGWPLVGLAAELTGAVFVERARRQNTADVNAAIADRMAGGDPVVLFAEGTSSDGNRVLQFRSAWSAPRADCSHRRSRKERCCSHCPSSTRMWMACRWAASIGRWSPGMATPISCRT